MKKILVDAVHTFIDINGNISERLYKLLEDYPNKKIIVTNANYKEDNKFKLNDMPYLVYTLKNDPPKTKPEFFKALLEHFDLSIEDVVYFEHNNEAVESARSLGIPSYHFDKENRDFKELKKFIDQNL